MQHIISTLKGLELGSSPYCFWLFCAALVFFYPLEKRSYWPLRLVGCAAAFTLLGWLFPAARWNGSIPSVLTWYVLAWLLISLQCWFICKITPTEAFFCGINAVLTEHIGSSVQILLTVQMFHGSLLRFDSYSMLAYAVVDIVVWLTIGRKMTWGKKHLRVNRLGVIAITAFGLIVTVVLSMLLKSNVDSDLVFVLADRHSIALLEIGQLYAIFFCVAMLVLEYIQQRELTANASLAASHELWTVRQKQYEMSRETIETINRKCHDMKHQIAALMAEDSGDADRQCYSEEVQRLIEVYDLQVNTKNEALNTILMERGLYCSTHGIRWNCAVDDTTLEFIKSMDLYVLLGNALDNAVEAVERIEDRQNRIIQLQISRKGRFACIRLENNCDGALEWQEDLPLTTKRDKSSHGIGLKSIRDIAQKYQGDLSVTMEGTAFILSVLIPIPQ